MKLWQAHFFLQLTVLSSFSLKISAALKNRVWFWAYKARRNLEKKIYSAANSQLLRQIRSPGRFSSLQILFWCFTCSKNDLKVSLRRSKLFLKALKKPSGLCSSHAKKGGTLPDDSCFYFRINITTKNIKELFWNMLLGSEIERACQNEHVWIKLGIKGEISFICASALFKRLNKEVSFSSDGTALHRNTSVFIGPTCPKPLN